MDVSSIKISTIIDPVVFHDCILRCCLGDDFIDYIEKENIPIDTADRDGTTLLMAICEIDETDIVEYLVRKGANVNAVNKHGDTPLHYAVGYSHYVSLLIKNGAKVNAKNNKGHIPLHNAVREDAVSSVEKLVEHGADIEAVSDKGKLPIDMMKDYRINKFIENCLISGSCMEVKGACDEDYCYDSPS